MPLYEYRCSGCGQQFEQLRKMQDADRELTCPQCRSQEVARLLSVFAPHTASAASGRDMTPCGQPANMCCRGGVCPD